MFTSSKTLALTGTLLTGLLLSACSDPQPVGDTVTLVTYDSWAVSDEVLEDFTEQTGLKVELVQSGDAGEMVNRALLTKGNPEGDVLFGVDNNLLVRAQQDDLFQEYESTHIDRIPEHLRQGTDGVVTPIDTGDVCINYDKAYFAKGKGEGRGDDAPAPPQTLADLAEPQYEDLLVVENPASSSPGLAFLLATIAQFGPDNYLEYWSRLRDNGVRIEDSWSTAYYQRFSGGAGEGNRPLVVSYASSPAAEVMFADTPPSTAPTAAVLSTCYEQIEYAGVLANAANPVGAQNLIDFMLTRPYQEDIPGSNVVYPVLPEAELPQEFIDHAPEPEAPFIVDPQDVAQNREQWVDDWTATMTG